MWPAGPRKGRLTISLLYVAVCCYVRELGAAGIAAGGYKGRKMRRLLAVLCILAVAVLLALPAGPSAAGTSAHAAITITSNAGFSTCGCVTRGNGTSANPYIIGPWSIAAPSGGSGGWSVKIDNSKGLVTDYFNIFGISSTYNDTTTTTDPTIWLVSVHTATTISGTSASPTGGNDLGIGVELDSSANIAIDGVSYNKGNGDLSQRVVEYLDQ